MTTTNETGALCGERVQQRTVAECRGCGHVLTPENARLSRGRFVGACRPCESSEGMARTIRRRIQRMIADREEVREEMIRTLTPSVGTRKHAEYVVNSLTVHHPDLLRRAAALWAPRGSA